MKIHTARRKIRAGQSLKGKPCAVCAAAYRLEFGLHARLPHCTFNTGGYFGILFNYFKHIVIAVGDAYLKGVAAVFFI